MARKLTCVFLALLLIFNMTAALADVYGLATQKLATRTGPGTQYTEGGTYNVAGQYIRILSRAYDSRNEIWWVKCEIPYNGQTRILWTGWKRFDHNATRLEDIPIDSNYQSGGGSSGNYSSGVSSSGSYSSGNGSYGGNNSRSSGCYDMGIPSIGSRVYRSDEMNMTVFWVQTQMKATGVWYQGENWDCTGRMGEHTMSEIRSFMRSRGYSNHSGQVDQSVINELVSYLGSRVRPVMVGGYYNYMGSIMNGGSTGSMNVIWSNLIDNVPHVTVGARWIQVCLKRLGYYNSSIDGKYGEGTERAVMAFQQDYGWVQRNYVTLGVARAMLEAYYARGGSLYDLP